MPLSIFALGANLPGRYRSPAEAVEAGIAALASVPASVSARSRLYLSPAWPDPSDPEFVNAVVLAETEISPEDLLARLKAIETEFGRETHYRNAPRPLDLDIIDYGARVSEAGEDPMLPHPRLTERGFVLLPLREVAPEWRHPVTGIHIDRLIDALPLPHSAVPIRR
jgi:2-amino-4-hydroxy-6-hydroxymethyldihydropteridine diphosphokinase